LHFSINTIWWLSNTYQVYQNEETRAAQVQSVTVRR
jgi:hypothetical protein